MERCTSPSGGLHSCVLYARSRGESRHNPSSEGGRFHRGCFCFAYTAKYVTCAVLLRVQSMGCEAEQIFDETLRIKLSSKLGGGRYTGCVDVEGGSSRRPYLEQQGGGGKVSGQ